MRGRGLVFALVCLFFLLKLFIKEADRAFLVFQPVLVNRREDVLMLLWAAV